MKSLLPAVKEKLFQDHAIEVSIETLIKYVESLPTWLIKAIMNSPEFPYSYRYMRMGVDGIEFIPQNQEPIKRLCYLITHKW